MSDTHDPFAGQEIDGAPAPSLDFDPFGDEMPEDATGSGGSNPHSFPSLFTLAQKGGHLIVLEPTGFDPAANDPNDPEGKKTRPEFIADLHVLAGPPIEVKVRKYDENLRKWTDTGEYEELGGNEHPWPIKWSRQQVAQKILVGQCREKFDTSEMKPKGTGRWLGWLRLVPSKTSPDHLKNAKPDAMDVALDEFNKRKAAGRMGTDPKPGIKIMNPTAPDVQSAREYWKTLG